MYIDVNKEPCDKLLQSGDYKQIKSSLMQEVTCDSEPCLASMELAHLDNDNKFDQHSQMLEYPGLSLSVAGDNVMNHQLIGKDKVSHVGISKDDSESNDSHAITVNASTNQSEWLELHDTIHLVETSPKITSDSTETKSSKLHSYQLTFEDRDQKSEISINLDSEIELCDRELEFNRQQKHDTVLTKRQSL